MGTCQCKTKVTNSRSPEYWFHSYNLKISNLQVPHTNSIISYFFFVELCWGILLMFLCRSATDPKLSFPPKQAGDQKASGNPMAAWLFTTSVASSSVYRLQYLLSITAQSAQTNLFLKLCIMDSASQTSIFNIANYPSWPRFARSVTRFWTFLS